MARMKFLCDAERCIECNACVTACKNEHDVPWGINRRRVVTINDGKPGERSISMACMHCTDAPCAAVCPVDCFYTTADGVVLHSKDLCIGCGYCFYACPFGAPQYPRLGNFGTRGKMDKCTYCAGGPETDSTPDEYAKYGSNRLAEGKLPLCAEMCSTKALLAGVGLGAAGAERALVHLAAHAEGARLRELRRAERAGVEAVAAADAKVLAVQHHALGHLVDAVHRAHRDARRVGAVHAGDRDGLLALEAVVQRHDPPAVDAPGHLVLVLAGDGAGVALDAALDVAEESHSRHGSGPVAHAFSIWQRLTFVSCIMVTAS